ncbi:hypothetical protein [Euzebya tangerina]|uniref:hypothetical protein n=1 Tax=Euzebya tangerina TaxID=591198 RepID=UPI0013C34BBB|nr:hypothetical protein [Euzebya tangerina]
MSAMQQAWDFELSSALAAHRPTLGWLPDHLIRIVPNEPIRAHLLSMASDLCDAGHVHLDIIMWLLTDTELQSVIVSEEHYDRGPESVDTTFETTMSCHPLDTIVGTQISTASHPDGLQLDVSLAVMLNTPGQTGHADPISLEDPDVIGYALSMQPQSLSFTVGPEKTDELIAFGRDLLDARTTSRLQD